MYPKMSWRYGNNIHIGTGKSPTSTSQYQNDFIASWLYCNFCDSFRKYTKKRVLEHVAHFCTKIATLTREKNSSDSFRTFFKYPNPSKISVFRTLLNHNVKRRSAIKSCIATHIGVEAFFISKKFFDLTDNKLFLVKLFLFCIKTFHVYFETAAE